MLRCLRPDTVETRSLQFLTEERRQLVNQHTCEVQSLTSWLKQVFPQIVQWFDDAAYAPGRGSAAALARLCKICRRPGPKPCCKFFHQHNCRSEERTQQRLDQIRTAVPATNDPALLQTGVSDPFRHSVRMLATLRPGDRRSSTARSQAVYQTHPDRFIIESLPGAGPALEPRLIAAVGTVRDRFRSAPDMACCFGIAPVTESSGNARWVHWRWACSKFVRQTFHEWAACSVRQDGWARDLYERQRAKGKGHHAASAASPSNGFASSSAAGAIASPIPTNAIWKRSAPTRRQIQAGAERCRTCIALPAVQWKTCGGFSKPTKLSS